MQWNADGECCTRIEQQHRSPPPLHSKRSRAPVPPHPRGNTPPKTPSDGSVAPPVTMQRTRNTKQDVQAQRRMNNKMSRELPVGMRVQLC